MYNENIAAVSEPVNTQKVLAANEPKTQPAAKSENREDRTLKWNGLRRTENFINLNNNIVASEGVKFVKITSY